MAGRGKIWVGMKETTRKQAGGTEQGIGTLRVQNGKMVGNPKGNGEVVAEHYRKTKDTNN